jgi:ABC-type dipeptide/oligopeptide/nickel transport system ATPase component
MHGGRVVEEADVFSIFRDPQHDYAKKLLALAPHLGLTRSHP